MPPKKKQQESQKNKSNKQVQKAADKTFGLKNKNKSAKVQRYVAQVEQQTMNNTAAEKRKAAEAARRAAEKKAAEAARAEAAALFKPAQKVPFGVDPKSVVCMYFKQGACTKGKNCKFSHDLTKERKAEKKNLYEDDKDKEKDTMEDWDEEKLRSVVLSKHGNPKTTTDIVCKYFIEAVENGKYGWFWACPNGGDKCKYKHSLPPGFVLKTKEQRRLEREAAANQPQITLEELVETERAKLPKSLTPVTLDSFTEWKKKRDDALKLKEKDSAAKKKDPSKQLSGREIFLSGKYARDDDEDDLSDAWDFTALRRRADEEPADESNE